MGHLVEYKHPLPNSLDLVGIVVHISEVSSNVYEKGYLEAEVQWSGKEPITTEDASLLKILS